MLVCHKNYDIHLALEISAPIGHYMYFSRFSEEPNKVEIEIQLYELLHLVWEQRVYAIDTILLDDEVCWKFCCNHILIL